MAYDGVQHYIRYGNLVALSPRRQGRLTGITQDASINSSPSPILVFLAILGIVIIVFELIVLLLSFNPPPQNIKQSNSSYIPFYYWMYYRPSISSTDEEDTTHYSTPIDDTESESSVHVGGVDE